LAKLKASSLDGGTLYQVEYQLKELNAKEAMQLIENGFEYVTEIEGVKLFRKRK
jgi:hypothetical protein